MDAVGDLCARANPVRGFTESAGRRVAVGLGAAGGAIGAIYLALWFGGVPPHWSAAGVITMKANTAVANLLAGAGLLLLGVERAGRMPRALAAFFGTLVALIGAATLVERLWTVDLGIDQLVAYEPPGMGNSVYPNRMGIPPALAFTLLGSGLIALAARKAISRWVAGLACLVVLVPAVGVAYGIGPLHADVRRGMCLSWPTLVALLALGVSLSLMDPRDGSTSVLYRQDQGGRLLRRTLLPGFFMPLLFGYVGLLGDRWGLYDRYVGMALLVVAVTTALLALLWRSAHWLSAADAERVQAVAALETANEQLREADRRKDEFLGMLSHELRNPLAPIRSALFIQARADPGSKEAQRAREVIERQAMHLTRLVDDLLDVTRVARGRIALRRGPVDLATLARRTAEDHRAVFQERDLALALELPGAPVVVDGDETRLTQVLGNLLSNAAKFTPEGGRVALTLRTDGARAIIHVSDTGPGIPPDLQSTIFEPFVQGRQTLARSEGGLGLGLALVKALVSLHGGEVTVASRSGADFAVTIPLAAQVRARPRGDGPARAAPTPQRRRVLVVDDNEDAAQTVAQIVAMLGHDVRIVRDGPSALEGARTLRPDLVLCDIGLPGMDGYEVARRLRATSGVGVRIVALTGYARPEDVTRALEAGFDVHLAKPPDPDRLAGILAQA